MALLPKHSTDNSKHSTKMKTNFSIYIFMASVVFGPSIGKAIISRSIVFLQPLQHFIALCPYLPQLWHFPLNFPYDMPNSIGV